MSQSHVSGTLNAQPPDQHSMTAQHQAVSGVPSYPHAHTGKDRCVAWHAAHHCPMLELRAQDNPCFREDIDGRLRFHAIGQLPSLKILNRSSITARETRAASTLPQLPAADRFAFGRSRSRRHDLSPTGTRLMSRTTAAAVECSDATEIFRSLVEPEVLLKPSTASSEASPIQLGPAPMRDAPKQLPASPVGGARTRPSIPRIPAASAWKLPPPVVIWDLSMTNFKARHTMILQCFAACFAGTRGMSNLMVWLFVMLPTCLPGRGSHGRPSHLQARWLTFSSDLLSC